MPEPELIYLASPYTFNGRSKLRNIEDRFLRVCHCAGWLFKNGNFVYSPITHTHPIKQVTDDMPGGWEFWSAYDRKMISVCDVFMVFTLPGWEQSIGVQEELKIAAEYEKNVFYITERHPEEYVITHKPITEETILIQPQ